ncbi:MAG: protoheme IX farnesyltransferase [Candidatus Eremiobacteraeota bacterium]|nr:protoheme IX farnesyltransferase [Candidatus Eremiobacteraeota bacterium]
MTSFAKSLSARVDGFTATMSDLYELSKPRIISLLLITTAAAMVMAARGIPRLSIFALTLIGGALASASAGAFNCIVDSDIDGLMRRTCARPLPTGRLSLRVAAVYAVTTGALSFGLLYAFVNPLSAWLSLGGNLYYVVVYTLLLKRMTPLNIVIGGAAGAIPPLVGWAAVTGTIGGPALALFALIFLWTPPHFWSLALMTETDYDRARIPMLPNVSGVSRTKKEIVAYTFVLVAVSLAFVFPLHLFGWIYGAAALALGAIFTIDALRVYSADGRTAPRRLFTFSLLYLALVCAAMVVDRILI